MPRVSIIMSVFDGHIDFLKQSIESVLNQSFSDIEFIVVSDGAKQNIFDTIEKYASSDARIRIIKNRQNIGLTKSLNIAIKEARGEFIARMDDDDISHPLRIEEQIAHLVSNEFDLIGCDCNFIDEKNNIIKEKKIIFPVNLKKRLLQGNFFTHSTFFGKKRVFDELYDEKFKRSQDYEFLLRIASKKYKIGYLSRPLLLYRVSEKSISEKNAKEQEWCAIKARWKAIRKCGYSKAYSIYFLRAFLSFLIPYDVKKFIIYRILK